MILLSLSQVTIMIALPLFKLKVQFSQNCRRTLWSTITLMGSYAKSTVVAVPFARDTCVVLTIYSRMT